MIPSFDLAQTPPKMTLWTSNLERCQTFPPSPFPHLVNILHLPVCACRSQVITYWTTCSRLNQAYSPSRTMGTGSHRLKQLTVEHHSPFLHRSYLYLQLFDKRVNQWVNNLVSRWPARLGWINAQIYTENLERYPRATKFGNLAKEADHRDVRAAHLWRFE